ncbi:hypothetical protein J4E82_001287 [Alternaria postmessia]|nr:uncharacterized protein J4E82_001287 [Alternaria postmessia]KAI5379744.1 hypothetical protein J4E82_001287 [Alternaria postmessia]
MPSSLIRLPLATPLRLESLGSRRSLAATLPCSQRHGLGMIAREPHTTCRVAPRDPYHYVIGLTRHDSLPTVS